MSLNLHSIVRPYVTVVNPDQGAVYLASAGYTVDAAYKQIPAYSAPADVFVQVQSLAGKDLRHEAFTNVQGVKRAVYMFGNTLGVARPDVKGGDLLQFPETLGGTVRNWLVVVVLETWNPDAAGWCKLGVVLQQDLPA